MLFAIFLGSIVLVLTLLSEHFRLAGEVITLSARASLVPEITPASRSPTTTKVIVVVGQQGIERLMSCDGKLDVDGAERALMRGGDGLYRWTCVSRQDPPMYELTHDQAVAWVSGQELPDRDLTTKAMRKT